jgi:hypothetical protein
VAVDLVAELVDQADRLQVLAQGEAPGRQRPLVVDQFEVADAGVVVVAQRQAGAVGPARASRCRRGARQQRRLVTDQYPFGET